MKPRLTGLILLIVQLVLVLTVAANYLYERRTSARVWVRAGQFDPEMPLRGRYLPLQPVIDACKLPRDAAHFTVGYRNEYTKTNLPGHWSWPIVLNASGGQLVPQLEDNAKRPSDTFQATLEDGKPCERVAVNVGLDYFIPDRAKIPQPLRSGQELWVEVTVPPSGPPRAIQLAVSSAGSFRILAMN